MGKLIAGAWQSANVLVEKEILDSSGGDESYRILVRIDLGDRIVTYTVRGYPEVEMKPVDEGDGR